MFASWEGGLSTLTDALLRDVDVEVRLGSRVTALHRDADGYLLDVEGASAVDADAVILAIPSSAAARLLEPHAPGAAEPLRRQRTARIATVVLGFPRALVADLPALAGNGILVPSTTGTLLKAVTHLSTKWPHLDGEDTYLLRMSAGRDGSDELDGLDDDALVARLLVDLARFTGIEAEPTLVHVQRWPTGLPQLHVGHLERLHAVRAELAQRLPGVQLAGAAYEGVGLTSCITSAQTAADAVLTALRGRQAP
jgi:oxygen-dependent protoporphyrinogen oxidase